MCSGLSGDEVKDKVGCVCVRDYLTKGCERLHGQASRAVFGPAAKCETFSTEKTLHSVRRAHQRPPQKIPTPFHLTRKPRGGTHVLGIDAGIHALGIDSGLEG